MDMFSKEYKDDIDNDDETCGICLDEIAENDIGVTKCGHIFCYECLKAWISRSHACPYCKKKLNDNEIYILSYQKAKKDDEQNSAEKDKAELANEIGTKLANIISYLRESGEHTIIFSQWDDLLRRVGRILKDNNIPNVFCKGNCYQRDKAIREFNDDEKIRVIMLSSDSTAAGTNLTKASQVIFIDPIYGDYKFRKDQERQAIGRAHRLGQKSQIKVIRFIIQDSIEDEIYKMNIIEDKKYQSEFESLNEIF
jgi:SNF2 family DNA or RNA helicase